MTQSVILGSGYVGGALALRLLAAGHRVSTVNRSGASVDGAVALRADLADREGLLRAIPRADLLFLTVAADGSDEASYRAAYVEGAHSMVRLATTLGVSRMLFTSSTGVYGQEDGSWVDEMSPTEPAGFRGATMLEAEQILQSAPVSSCVLRLSGIYGPGRVRLIRDARLGVRVDRRRFTNRIHRDDAARALLHLSSVDSAETHYVVSDSEPALMHEVLDWIAAELGVSREAAAFDALATSGKRCGNRRLLDSGFELRYPSFREGYRELLGGMTR